MNTKRVIVIGGGLAGLMSARALAASGRVQPLVLEAAPRLGGKAASWRDDQQRIVESGLHVCFPHYHQLLGLLDALGLTGAVAWGGALLSYVRGEGQVATLRFPPLPAPLHGAMALLSHRQLALADRMSALFGAAEATLSTPGWRARHDPLSFGQWARSRGLSQRLIDVLLEPLVRGLTFLTADQASARAVLDYVHVVGRSSEACRIGTFRGALGEVLIEPLAADVRRRGGIIQVNHPVQRLRCGGGARHGRSDG